MAITAAEIQILVNAETGDAERDLKRVEETVGRFGGLGGVFDKLLAPVKGLVSGLGQLGFAAMGVEALAGAAAGMAQSLFGGNVAIENVQAALMAFTKDAGAASQLLDTIRQRAAKTPFAFQEMASAVVSLLPAAKQSGVALEELLSTAEILAALNPAEGLEGAAFALREALSGDFVSIVERFNLPRQYLNQLKEQGVPAIEAVRMALREMGADSSLVANLALTASGRWSTFIDTLRTLRDTAMQPVFRVLSDGLAQLQGWLDRNNERLTGLAQALGARLASAVVIARDAVLTFAQALTGNWTDAEGIHALHRVIGNIGLVIRNQVIPAVTSLWNAFKLLVTGDFQGGIFGLEEDSPVIAGLLRLREVVVSVFAELRAQFQSFWAALATGQGDGSFGAQLALGLRAVAQVIQTEVLPALAVFAGWFLTQAIPALQAFWASAQPVVSGIFGFIRDNLPTILPMLATFTATFAGLSAVAGPIQALAGSVNTLFTVLRTGVSVASVLSSLVTLLGGPLTLAIVGVAAAAAGLYLAWQTNFLGIRDIVAQVWAAAQPVLQGIIDHVQRFATEIAPLAAAAWENIRAAVSAVLGFVAETVVTVFGEITAFVREHGEEIKTILSGAWDVIVGIVTTATAVVEGIIKTVLAVIAGDWEAAWNALRDMLGGVWDGIKTIVSGALDILKGVIQIALGEIKGIWESIWGAIRDAAGQLIEEAKGKIQAGIDGIKGLFTGARTWLVQAGRDIVQGLIDGITSMAGELLRRAREIADSVASAIRGALDISSPSRVMVEIGRAIGAGLALGIRDMARPVEQAMRQAMSIPDGLVRYRLTLGPGVTPRDVRPVPAPAGSETRLDVTLQLDSDIIAQSVIRSVSSRLRLYGQLG